MADKLPAAVSGGQQQSAAIARALANDPPILIADEPTGNLDSRTADEVFNLFAGLIDQGKSILMVTHDIGLARRTTRTLLISDGEIISPWVAGALHHVSHNQMLWLTHHLKPKMLLPGEMLNLPFTEEEWLLLVTGGQLEMIAQSHNGSQPTVAGLGSGSLLYSQDLKAGGWAGSSVRAGQDEPVEILIVEGPDFNHWLHETHSAQTSFQQAAQEQRLAWSQQPILRVTP
jgi:putative ABC transport system ATP-binding protein